MTTNKNNMGRNCNCTKSMVKYRQKCWFFNPWNIGLWNSCWRHTTPHPSSKGPHYDMVLLGLKHSVLAQVTLWSSLTRNPCTAVTIIIFEGNIISLFLWRCTFSWCLSYILCCRGRKKCHTLLQCFWETLSSTYLDQSWWLGSSIVSNCDTYCEWCEQDSYC